MKKLLLSIATLLFPLSAEILEIGTVAPDFTILSAVGDQVTLSSFRDKKLVVLVFYPGDNTPVCTKQLCELRDNYEDLSKIDAEVLGINPADSASHAGFSVKNSYQFPLLIDENSVVAKKYGREGGFLGTKRAVFVVDKSGKIIFSKKGKPPVEDIISAISSQKK